MIQQTAEQSAFIKALSEESYSIALNAVAGSGKTTTLVLAAQALKPKPNQVLALAFNKKNAQDLEKKMPPAVDCMTLNALGHRAWQQRIGKRLFLNDRKVGEIASELCKEQQVEDSWADLKNLIVQAKNVGLVPSDMTGCVSMVEDSEENWNDLIAKHNIEDFKGLIPLARKGLRKSIAQALQGTIDFADQLYMTACYKAKMPQYPIVLVDEAQDLSEIQHELIARCVAEGGRLIAVGDPKQAIYGFRGAHSNSMEVLKTQFSMTELGLTCSFRCPQAVIRLAQEIVPQITCLPEAPEGLAIWLDTRKDDDKDSRSWAVTDLKPDSVILCRNIAPLIKLGFECFRNSVSCWVAVRDIGAPLIKASKELDGENAKELYDSISQWYEKKVLFANSNLELISRAEDVAEALRFVVESINAKSAGDIEDQLRRLFSKDGGSLTLTTIHRAKGLEWDRVYLLDPWRIPAKFAVRAANNDPAGCGWMLEQEAHLRYIALTRAKQELYFISYPEG